MKIFILKGSPNKEGNTNILLERFFDGVKEQQKELEIRTFDAYQEPAIEPCVDCKICDKTGRCVYPDFSDKILKNVLWADIVVFAAPIYFMSFPAPLKSIVDRFQIFFSPAFNEKIKDQMGEKKGIFITTFGGPGTGYDSYLKDLTYVMFGITMKMNEYELLLAENTDKIKTCDNTEALKNAYKLGQNI